MNGANRKVIIESNGGDGITEKLSLGLGEWGKGGEARNPPPVDLPFEKSTP